MINAIAHSRKYGRRSRLPRMMITPAGWESSCLDVNDQRRISFSQRWLSPTLCPSDDLQDLEVNPSMLYTSCPIEIQLKLENWKECYMEMQRNSSNETLNWCTYNTNYIKENQISVSLCGIVSSSFQLVRRRRDLVRLMRSTYDRT